MPHKALHPCNQRGCPRLTSGRFCHEHKREYEAKYDRERGTAAERGYDSAIWAKVRRMKLASDPLCERCQISTPATMVHHKDRNPKNNEESNLESLCRYCHEKEHKEDKEINQKRSDLRLAIVRLLVAFENETDLEISRVKLKRDEEEQWEVDVKIDLGD